MPYRKSVLATREIYHIFNRGVAQMPIFTSAREYKRFLSLIDYYRHSDTALAYSHLIRLERKAAGLLLEKLKRESPLNVEILSYCLMPNHFHILLRQASETGISTALSNLQNGYARFFNLRHERRGPLFESIFKAVRVETDDQLLHVSRYIHLNPVTSFIIEIENLSEYPWSSYREYTGEQDPLFTNTQMILDLVGGCGEYKEFVINQADYQKKLAKIKHLTLE